MWKLTKNGTFLEKRAINIRKIVLCVPYSKDKEGWSLRYTKSIRKVTTCQGYCELLSLECGLDQLEMLF